MPEETIAGGKHSPMTVSPIKGEEMKTKTRQQILEAKQKAMKLRALNSRQVEADRSRPTLGAPGSALALDGRGSIGIMQEFLEIPDSEAMSTFLAKTAVLNKMGVVDDEKAWTDLVEVFRVIGSKSLAETLVADHLAAIKAVSLGTHFHHELALKLVKILSAQIDAIRFLRKRCS
jgi:hypothetical protein